MPPPFFCKLNTLFVNFYPNLSIRDTYEEINERIPDNVNRMTVACLPREMDEELRRLISMLNGRSFDYVSIACYPTNLLKPLLEGLNEISELSTIIPIRYIPDVIIPKIRMLTIESDPQFILPLWNHIQMVDALKISIFLKQDAVFLCIKGCLFASNAFAVMVGALNGSTLKQLTLNNCNISDRCTNQLAHILPNCQLLEGLDLSDNNVDDITELARALPHSQIKKLILSNNDLDNDGLFELARLLPSSKVVELDLSFSISDEVVVQALAAALGQSTTLKHLNIEDCDISEEGLLMIANSQHQLTWLSLSDNDITNRVANEFLLRMRHPIQIWFEEDDDHTDRVQLMSSRIQMMTTLLSVRDVPRLGVHSHIRVLPNHLIRELCEFLFDEVELFPE